MRLHRLTVQAFGPFADPVEVDFDALSEASLFLLCGDTGAGKSTVLDAVCFALYGDVPSDRAVARQLRSHHAAEGMAPRVVLEATVAGRRLRVTRSPAWRRPKKRGTGTTTEQAHVLVEEDVGGDWLHRTNRLDEAGHLLGDLMGMTLAQFSQVVLLPQGQFDTFLRSSSEERQQVLTRLFRTTRFEQIERWFGDRRRALHREHQRHQAHTAAVLHRISETAGTALPDRWADDPTPAVADGLVAAWADELLAEAHRARGRAVEVEADARTARDRCRAELDAGRLLQRHRRRHAAALAARAELDASAAEAEQDRTLLDGARRAASVVPLIAVAEESAAAADELAARATELVGAVTETRDAQAASVDDAWLAAALAEATDAVATARSMTPRADELRRVREDHRQRVARAAELSARIAAVGTDLAALPARIEVLADEVGRLRETVATTDARRQALAAAEERLDAAVLVDGLLPQLEVARERALQAREHVAELKERLLSLRERRLTGMAAELAASVAVGQSCPVCGSQEHPALARPDEGAPTRADEESARSRLDDAELVATAAQDRLHGLEARLAAARALAGEKQAAVLREAADEARAAVEECAAAATTLEERSAVLDTLTARRTTLADELAAAEREESANAGQIEQLAERATAVETELAGVLGDAVREETTAGGDEDGCLEELAGLIARHERRVAALERARAALEAREHQRGQARRAAARARAAADQQGFDSLDGVAAAALDADQLTGVERRLRDRDRRHAEIDAVLSDGDVLAAVAMPLPDLPALESAAERAETAVETAVGIARAAVARADRLTQRTGELTAALAAWEPVRAEHALVAGLAELVEGKGSDNSRQLRLSAYVLAARLGQVVAAANERLVRMTDARYLLEQTDLRGAGDRRGGLGLLVLDQWTDERRDPVTLSGGETFVVSLALALGLADVVTAEAGGNRIDTLFVDEGFGALDADTLELVMDTLDQLREGGRVVGVVSHVAEMRGRIPSRLEVVKHRTGSTLRTVCAGA